MKQHLYCLACMAGLFFLPPASADGPDYSALPRVNLPQYMGTWYEIARIDNRFERGLRNVKAHYTPAGKSRIRVVNSGQTADGRLHISEGRAVAADSKRQGALAVSFVWPYCFFRQPYNILYLSADGQRALVGSDSPNYLWLLARQASISPKERNELLQEAKRRGFDCSRLADTPQSEACGGQAGPTANKSATAPTAAPQPRPRSGRERCRSDRGGKPYFPEQIPNFPGSIPRV